MTIYCWKYETDALAEESPVINIAIDTGNIRLLTEMLKNSRSIILNCQWKLPNRNPRHIDRETEYIKGEQRIFRTIEIDTVENAATTITEKGETIFMQLDTSRVQVFMDKVIEADTNCYYEDVWFSFDNRLADYNENRKLVFYPSRDGQIYYC